MVCEFETSFLFGNSSKLLWFGSWKAFVNIIPEWPVSECQSS